MRDQEDNLSKATSSLFSIKMIADSNQSLQLTELLIKLNKFGFHTFQKAKNKATDQSVHLRWSFPSLFASPEDRVSHVLDCMCACVLFSWCHGLLCSFTLSRTMSVTLRDIMWASTRENLSSAVCKQHRRQVLLRRGPCDK